MQATLTTMMTVLLGRAKRPCFRQPKILFFLRATAPARNSLSRLQRTTPGPLAGVFLCDGRRCTVTGNGGARSDGFRPRHLPRSANMLIKQHGGKAPIYAALKADEMHEAGDLDGKAVWVGERCQTGQWKPRIFGASFNASPGLV